MGKLRTQYACNECGGITYQWAGRCGDCGAWNALTEVVLENKKNSVGQRGGYSGQVIADINLLSDITSEDAPRFTSGIEEFDRVLGGGFVAGAVILMGGDPGIGKSTLLLQSIACLSQEQNILYVTGEESLEQVSLRAKRLDIPGDNIHVLAETNIEYIFNKTQKHKPKLLVIDSIQTVFTEQMQSAPGSVSQVRECAAQLVRFAKQSKTTVVLVGHVTKEGALAGPRVLEHMVDTVLYFEGDRDTRFRAVRAVKNRFGAVNELGIFVMTERGLREVNNPSAIFVSSTENVPGSVVMVTWEGSRPLLVELQALVDESHMPNPRRVAIGMDLNRLTLVLAVLSRHGGAITYNRDVFANVVGGVKVTETGADLALLLAIYSSLQDIKMPKKTVIFGEIGLAGEIRPVQCGQERLKEAAKLGYEQAIISPANAPKKPISGLNVKAVSRVSDALNAIR